MAAFRKIWWPDFTASEFDGIDPMKTIAILPIGSHRAAWAASAGRRRHHSQPGLLETLTKRGRPTSISASCRSRRSASPTNISGRRARSSLPAHTQIEPGSRSAMSVSRAGVKKLVFVNSSRWQCFDHGHRRPRIARPRDMLVVKTGWSSFATPDGTGQRSRKAPRHPCRRRRDVRDAALPARPGGTWARRRIFVRSRRATSSGSGTCGQLASMPMAGLPPISTQRGPSATQLKRRRSAERLSLTRKSRALSSCSARSRQSRCRASSGSHRPKRFRRFPRRLG